jgi:hypothetical protein
VNTLDKDQLKTVLRMTTSRLKDDWTLQLICTAVGLALVYNIADLPQIICKYFGQEACTPRSVAPIFMAVILYLFMKFGQQMTVEGRRLLGPR